MQGPAVIVVQEAADRCTILQDHMLGLLVGWTRGGPGVLASGLGTRRPLRGPLGGDNLPLDRPPPPGSSAASAPAHGCRRRGRAWQQRASSDWRSSGAEPPETPRRSHGPRPRVSPTSPAAPACPAVRPSAVPAPATAGSPPARSTAGPRHTRPVCAPVPARRRAFQALCPVAAHRWPASRRARRHTRKSFASCLCRKANKMKTMHPAKLAGQLRYAVLGEWSLWRFRMS